MRVENLWNCDAKRKLSIGYIKNLEIFSHIDWYNLHQELEKQPASGNTRRKNTKIIDSLEQENTSVCIRASQIICPSTYSKLSLLYCLWGLMHTKKGFVWSIFFIFNVIYTPHKIVFHIQHSIIEKQGEAGKFITWTFSIHCSNHNSSDYICVGIEVIQCVGCVIISGCLRCSCFAVYHSVYAYILRKHIRRVWVCLFFVIYFDGDENDGRVKLKS